MVGQDLANNVIERILENSKADQTEVVVMAREECLTRYAGSSIHQNTHQRDTVVVVRVAEGNKIGCCSTNDLSPEALDETVRNAIEIARNGEGNPDFRGLPAPAGCGPLVFPPSDSVQALESFSPEDRARMAIRAFETARSRGMEVSGALSTELNELGVGNSLGTRAYCVDTRAFMTAVVTSPQGGTSYSDRLCRNPSEIDPEGLILEAAERCELNTGQRSIEPGRYDVILLPYATAELVSYLGYMGMGARAYQEGTSFLCGKLGTRVFDEKIDIWDDGLDPNGLPVPFDYEGVPKKKVSIIEKGMAKSVVYDSYTAGREQRESTGHALPPPNVYGPQPCNLYMGPGDSTVEDLISSTRRGIFVTRFHYLGIVHPQKAIMTGMTRDGTFLVENGEIAGALKNLRFSESMIKAFNNVMGISDTPKLEQGILLAVSAPAVKISDFEFTGATG